VLGDREVSALFSILALGRNPQTLSSQSCPLIVVILPAKYLQDYESQ